MESKKWRKEVEHANQIHIQIKVLEALSKRKMTSQELREFIESHGGDYYRILPLLKNAKLIKVEPVNDGKRGRKFVYSIDKKPSRKQTMGDIPGAGQYIKDLSKDLKISSSNLYQCVKFAQFIQEKFNSDLSSFIGSYKTPMDENLTWTYIVDNLLYEHRLLPFMAESDKNTVIFIDNSYKKSMKEPLTFL